MRPLPKTAIRVGGQYIDLLHPSPKVIDWTQLAHAMAGINRWLHHTQIPISVLVHSINVGSRVRQLTSNPNVVLAGLIHDAHEALVGDMPTPIKRIIPEFKERIELPWQDAVFASLGLDSEFAHHPFVQQADLEVLVSEAMLGFGLSAEEVRDIWGVPYAPCALACSPLNKHVNLENTFLNGVKNLQSEIASQ